MTSHNITPLVVVDSLGVGFSAVQVVRSVSFALRAGDCLAVVGKSGSGKTTLLNALVGFTDPKASVRGSIVYRGEEMVGKPERAWKMLRGDEIGYVFQDPGASLTPNRKIGSLLTETLRAHGCKSGKEARRLSCEALGRMRFEDPLSLMDSYAWQLSGGMKQRVALAFIMLLRPRLVLADEPTSALDCISQASVVDELVRLRDKHETALVLVTHNMAVASRVADTLAVMKDGSFVEIGPMKEILSHPRHPYTQRLIEAARLETMSPRSKCDDISNAPLFLSLSNVTKAFGKGARNKVAVSGVSFSAHEGECFGIAGESGCGKSTLARIIAKIDCATKGETRYGVKHEGRGDEMSGDIARKDIQLMFQEPLSAFSARMTVGASLAEPLRNYRLCEPAQISRVVETALSSVHLDPAKANCLPHELSGGELQRATMARCHVVAPRLIIYDEPTSALDMDTQRQILDLIRQLRRSCSCTSLFISHDIGLLKTQTDRIAIMYKGRIVEIVWSKDVPTGVRHPYTVQMMESSYTIDTPFSHASECGETTMGFGTGCPFVQDCPVALNICGRRGPEFVWEGDTGIACHHPLSKDRHDIP